MQPIYFPHTYITAKTYQALSACFPKMMVYQPTLGHIPESMHQWRNTGKLEIRCPLREFETDIASSLKSYQYLGNTHHGLKGEIKNYHPSGVPFFDDTSPQKIRADLTRKMQEDEPSTPIGAPSTAQLMHAGLFLQMAQDFDIHQDGIHQDMATCIGMERNLFKHLKDDDDLLFQDLAFPLLPPAEAFGDHMLVERLSAWSRLFFYDILSYADGEQFPPHPVLLITPSQLLFDEIVTEEAENTVIFSLDSQYMEDASFSTTLSGMARATNMASLRETIGAFANHPPTAIKIAVIFNEPPLHFLAKRAEICRDHVPSLPGKKPQGNTLIGLVLTGPKGP
jgi:hypothetical protein